MRHQHAKGTGRVHLIWALRQQRQGLGPGSTVLLLLVRSRLQLGSNVTPQSLKLGVGASDLVNQVLHLLLGLHMLCSCQPEMLLRVEPKALAGTSRLDNKLLHLLLRLQKPERLMLPALREQKDRPRTSIVVKQPLRLSCACM